MCPTYWTRNESMTTKPTLHPSPFALDIFIKRAHPNSPCARDTKKIKIPTKVSDKKDKNDTNDKKQKG